MRASRLPADGFIEVRGARLEFKYSQRSESDETALVFLHEGLGCVDLWRDFPHQVADATGVSCFAYSRMGYGRSDPTPLPRSASFMHDEALLVLPQIMGFCGFRKIIYVAHSDGASIALINAAAAAPDALAGMVLMAPHVFVEPETLRGIEIAARTYRETALRQRLLAYHGERVDGAFWGWNQIWRDASFQNWNLCDLVPSIAVPTLLIQGSDDPYGTLAQLDAIESGMCAPVQRVVLDDCGHNPYRDKSVETLAHCQAFITRTLGLQSS
ncbi:MAG: alpha/beta hydrolase [Nitrospina sp.]|nr:alpha/beta hydrolase [Nitrospina sp.]